MKLLKNKKAFTLIEIMVSMALSAIISTTIIYVLKAGMDSWEYGHGQAVCQFSSEMAVDRIVEGDYFFDGLRESLEITKAGASEIHFIPWYVQKLERVTPGIKYELEVPLLQGASVPVGEVYNEKTREFEFKQINYFIESKGGEKKEFIRFDIVKTYPKARIIYYPDVAKKSNTIMQIYFNPKKEGVYRKYLGVEKPLFRGAQNIIGFKLRYFDNSNNNLDMSKIDFSKTLTTPVTAVEVEVTTESGSETYTLRSFVNIRKKGIAGTGIYLTENAEVLIPKSDEVKILTITNFGGITERSTAEILIESKDPITQTYLVKLFFDNINGMEFLTSYEIHYPRGEVVLTKEVNRPAYHGMNLLSVDSTGHYDYDDDDNVEDFVIFNGKDVVLKVVKMDIGGMNLFVR
ncbi:MAG: type II secretion system protein [Candidatus Aureabacteria bacterium]|nr:type II secretion system protein [Candidatus Auribacterota bacterium]